MQQIRSSQESAQDILPTSGLNDSRSTATSPFFNGYTSSHRPSPVNDRLETLERETNTFRSQINQAFVSPLNDSALNRSTTGKKSPPSARQATASRSPLLNTNRKASNDDMSTVMTNDGPFSRPLPHVPINRSKSLQAGPYVSSAMSTTMNNEELNILRSYKIHLEQMLRKDAPPYSDLKVPTYNSIEEVIRANEHLLLENERLRSELNRLKTESILLLRSMRNHAGAESNFGNERIVAERERQELAVELARQVEENKRLRKSLLIQSDKFVKLRQSTNLNETAPAAPIDHRLTPISAPQSLLNPNKISSTSKSTRLLLGNLGLGRPRTFNNGSPDPS